MFEYRNSVASFFQHYFLLHPPPRAKVEVQDLFGLENATTLAVVINCAAIILNPWFRYAVYCDIRRLLRLSCKYLQKD